MVELLCEIRGASWRIAQSEPGVSIHTCHGVQALHDQIGTLEDRDMRMPGFDAMTPNVGPAAGLNARQRRFVDEYICDLNATQAALRSGYASRIAKAQGSRLLTNVDIQRAIAARMAERSARTEVTADRALLELARIGFSDLRRVFDEQGRLKRPEQWDADIAAAISSVKVVIRKDGDEVAEVAEIRLWDKPSALEKICKHLGMFIADKTHEDDKSGGAITDLTESEMLELLQRRRALRARGYPAPVRDFESRSPPRRRSGRLHGRASDPAPDPAQHCPGVEPLRG